MLTQTIAQKVKSKRTIGVCPMHSVSNMTMSAHVQ